LAAGVATRFFRRGILRLAKRAVSCVAAQGAAMKRGLWHRWTVDKPAAFGDSLWDIFVVQFAAWLDRLTLRKIIAFIPVVILVLAYMHRIPIPPELMLVGDLLAYIDVFAMTFLLGMIARVEMVVYVLKRAIQLAIAGGGGVLTSLRRLNFRHGRAGGERARRKRGAVRAKQSDGDGEDVLIGAGALLPA
jgi:hypothetical protein